MTTARWARYLLPSAAGMESRARSLANTVLASEAEGALQGRGERQLCRPAENMGRFAGVTELAQAVRPACALRVGFDAQIAIEQ